MEFPAGDYNLTVVSDYGSVVVKRGDYEVFHSFLEAGQLTGEYRNLVLKEGDQIIIEEDYTGEGFEVHLDACEKIYPGVTSRKEITMADMINDETIEYVGILAKLELSAEEKEQAKKDMGRMLDYIDKLKELDTSGVEPMSHIFPGRECLP